MIDDVKLWRPGTLVAIVLGVDSPPSWPVAQNAVLRSDKAIYCAMNKAKITVAKLDRMSYNKSRSAHKPDKDEQK